MVGAGSPPTSNYHYLTEDEFMTQKTPIPKDQRPAAIERLLRDFRNRNPAARMPWKEVLQAVGGSERDLTKMMRTTKENILAEEAAIAAIPELPPEIGSEFERFSLSIWNAGL